MPTGKAVPWLPGRAILAALAISVAMSFSVVVRGANGREEARYTPRSVGSGCAPYMILDSRGSGGHEQEISPAGEAFATEFQKFHKGQRVAIISNPYPAAGLFESPGQLLNLIGAGAGTAPLGAYHASVVDGTSWLKSEVTSQIGTCPTQQIILIGYSQGAQATGDFYQRDTDSKERQHITAVVLFGDPYFNPTDKQADHGTFESDLAGVLGRRPSFGDDPRVLSYCRLHDPVCQIPNLVQVGLYGIKQHLLYKPWGTEAAEKVAAMESQISPGPVSVTITGPSSNQSFSAKFDNVTMPNTLSQSTKLLGQAAKETASVKDTDPVCTVTWPGASLSATFTTAFAVSKGGPCTGAAALVAFTLGDGWRTSAGLAVGSSVTVLQKLYPNATLIRGSWALQRYNYGAGFTVTELAATTKAGVVTSLQVAGIPDE
jgi:hypothetical protein